MSFTSEQLSRTFFNAILNFKNLNVALAKAILDKFTSDHEFVGLVGGSVPLLHHLIALYIQSRDVTQRRDIVAMTLHCISLGANVNEPFNSDPPVMFKALVLRELHLAKVLMEKTNIQGLVLERSHWIGRFLTNLYAIPSEPVPFAKLLLHADTIIRSKPDGFNAFGGLDGIKTLLAGASMGIDTKPTIGVVEMFSFSQTFENLLLKLGNEGGNKVLLTDLVTSLDETCSAMIHKAFLRQLFASPAQALGDDSTEAMDALLITFVHALSRIDNSGETNRNALHALCLSGGAEMVDDLTVFLANLNNSSTSAKVSDELRNTAFTLLARALMAEDSRGHSPISYAITRYGVDSDISCALGKLFTVVSTDYRGYIQRLINDKKQQLSTSVEDVTAGVTGASLDTASMTTNSKAVSSAGASNGGWNIPTTTTATTDAPCDIIEVHCDSLPSNAEFFEKYVNTATPVIFRGAALNSELREVFKKEKFLKRYGAFVVPSAVIPYADSFGLRGVQATLSQVVESQDKDIKKQQQHVSVKAKKGPTAAATATATDGDGDKAAPPPLYTFCTPSQLWSAHLLHDTPIPTCLTQNPTDDTRNSHIGDYSAPEAGLDGVAKPSSWQFEIQFYLGHKNTGAPVHFHGPAINTLVYGEKQWFLYPPSEAYYCTTAAVESFVPSTEPVEAPPAGTKTTVGPLRVTQRGGDVLFVPTQWGHGTLNTTQCIGVAHEFSVESFCME